MMRKEDVSLVNRILVEMRRLSNELDEFFKKEDFEGVLKTKKRLFELQVRVGELL